jgi:hypothetical protein
MYMLYKLVHIPTDIYIYTSAAYAHTCDASCICFKYSSSSFVLEFNRAISRAASVAAAVTPSLLSIATATAGGSGAASVAATTAVAVLLVLLLVVAAVAAVLSSTAAALLLLLLLVFGTADGVSPLSDLPGVEVGVEVTAAEPVEVCAVQACTTSAASPMYILLLCHCSVNSSMQMMIIQVSWGVIEVYIVRIYTQV